MLYINRCKCIMWMCAATRSEKLLVFSPITTSEVQPNFATNVCRCAVCVFYFSCEELPSSLKELLVSCAHTIIWWYNICVVPSLYSSGTQTWLALWPS